MARSVTFEYEQNEPKIFKIDWSVTKRSDGKFWLIYSEKMTNQGEILTQFLTLKMKV